VIGAEDIPANYDTTVLASLRTFHSRASKVLPEEQK
jgi:hypothetical protein